MKRILIAIITLLAITTAKADNDYIQVDWYPLLTDSVGFNITSGGLAFGFVNGANAEGPDFKMGSSFEFSWLNVIGAKFNTGHGQRISIGVGIDWKNYKLSKQQRFTRDGKTTIVTTYPTGATPKSSRFKVFALELPVIIRQRIGKSFDIFAGEITNFNVHASMETIYETATDGKVKESTSKDLHQTPITFDVIGGVQYKKVGAYVRYSPCRVIKKDLGPKFNTLSVGIVLGL